MQGQPSFYELPFPITRLRIEVDQIESAIPALEFRGRFGSELYRSVCIHSPDTSTPLCETCHVRESCGYTNLFKPNYFSSSHLPTKAPPLVFSHGWHNEIPYLTVSFLGRNEHTLKQCIDVLERIGKTERKVQQEVKIGSDYWRSVSSCDVVLVNTILIPPQLGTTNITFLSPVRVRKKQRWLNCHEFTSTDFLYALRKRIINLSNQLSVDRTYSENLSQLHPAQVKFTSKYINWVDAERRTAKKSIQHAGLVGFATLEGHGMSDWWPLLCLGQYLHIGKGAAHGLGQYVVS